MPKQQWLKGNFISDCQTKDWLKLDYIIDANGIRQLRVKAGSKWYYPDGLDSNNNPKYSIHTLTDDKVSNYAASANNKLWLYIPLDNEAALHHDPPNNMWVGSSATFIGSFVRWWDTTSNIIKWSLDSGSTWVTKNICLPFGIANYVKGYGVSDFIPFNFVGCMGNAIFHFPFSQVAGGGIDENNQPIQYPFSHDSVGYSTYTSAYDETGLNGMALLAEGDSHLIVARYGLRYFIQDDTPTETTFRWYQPKTNTMFLQQTGGTPQVNVNFAVARFSWNGTNKRFIDFKPFTTMDELSDYYC